MTLLRFDTHFTEDDLKCSCGCGYFIKQPVLVIRLELLRLQLERPIIINSWCRCNKHNIKEGGKPTSSHLTGWAVDLRCPTLEYQQALAYWAVKCEFHRIGFGKTFLHIDCDPLKPESAYWWY